VTACPPPDDDVIVVVLRLVSTVIFLLPLLTIDTSRDAIVAQLREPTSSAQCSFDVAADNRALLPLIAWLLQSRQSFAARVCQSHTCRYTSQLFTQPNQR